MLSEDEQDHKLRHIESFHEDLRYRVPKRRPRREERDAEGPRRHVR